VLGIGVTQDLGPVTLLTLKSTDRLASAESQFEWPRRAEIVRAALLVARANA
jgi:hypothetical protein